MAMMPPTIVVAATAVMAPPMPMPMPMPMPAFDLNDCPIGIAQRAARSANGSWPNMPDICGMRTSRGGSVPCLWDDLLQPGPAIGIVRPQRQFIQQGGNIGIRNCEAGRIDRSGERRILEAPPKPSSQLKPVEPQRCRQERLEKPLALRCVEPPQACIVASKRSLRRISRA
jgi:hypothetical protein